MAGGGGPVAASRQQPCEESLVRSNIDKARDSLRREEIKIKIKNNMSSQCQNLVGIFCIEINVVQ